MTGESPGSTCLWFPISGDKGPGYHAWLFLFSGGETQILWLACQALHQLSHLRSPQGHILLRSFAVLRPRKCLDFSWSTLWLQTMSWGWPLKAFSLLCSRWGGKPFSSLHSVPRPLEPEGGPGPSTKSTRIDYF